MPFNYPRNRRSMLAVLVAITWTAVVVAAAPDGATPSAATNTVTDASSISRAPRLIPLPEDVKVLRLGADGQLEAADTRGGFPELVYSNTPPLEPPQGGGITGVLSAAGAGVRVADDLETTARESCTLSNYEVGVSGGGDGTGFFDVTIALWDGCPSDGGQVIPGTQRTYEFLPDVNNVILVPLFFQGEEPPEPIMLPPRVWVSGEFSTDSAGFVVGSAPNTGYSADWYDHPETGCLTRLGEAFPTPIYAGFYAEIYAQAPCESHFRAYYASDRTGPILTAGAGVRLADDIELAIDEGELCELSAYELSMRGTGGSYDMRIDLRYRLRNGDQAGLFIPGTSWTSRDNAGNGELQVARFDAPEGIFLPRRFWITWQPNRDQTGAVLSEQARLGSSRDAYALFDEDNVPNPIWRFLTLASGLPAIAKVAVYCRGESSRGACCWTPKATDTQPDCEDDVTEFACFAGRWLEGRHCSENPFVPPCGTSACCTPTGCADLSPADCVSITDAQGRPSIWRRGEFCGVDGQKCFNFECYYSTQDCHSGVEVAPACTSDEECFDQDLGPCECGDGSFPPCELGVAACQFPVGCRDVECCDAVCEQDSVCCNPVAGWDSTCAAIAAETSSCARPPANDMCWHPDWPDFGAERIFFDESGSAFTEASLELATEGPDSPDGPYDPDALPEPPLCCNKLGVDTTGRGSVWYMFVAPHSSVRITTCGSDADPNADSIIQVFQTTTDDFRIEPMCRSLVPIACNDDAGESCFDPAGGAQPLNSDLCVTRLDVGRPYLVLLAASQEANKLANYRLRVQSPCPNVAEIPQNTLCGVADVFPPVVFPDDSVMDVPFDLTNAQFQCPGESCVEAMDNNVWWTYPAPCAGFLHIDTCEDDANASPDTTLAVYHNAANVQQPCPRSGGELLTCNDDADVSAEQHVYNRQACEVGEQTCDTSEDCSVIKVCSGARTCITNTDIVCTSTRDCPIPDNCEAPMICLDNTDCPAGTECEDQGFSGTCSDSGTLCRNAFDCRIGICREDGSACTVGDNTTCPWVCSISHDICEIDEDCNPDGIGQQTCNPQVCLLAETCLADTCQSSCGGASAITVPVNFNERYAIRLGGEYGNEPSGTLTLRCVHNDCNLNGIADITEPDCNDNDIPDQCDVNINDPDGDGLVSLDRDSNGIPDECVPPTCPDGEITFLNPDTMKAFAVQPPDFTDARQPHEIGDAGTPQGMDLLPISASLDADRVNCWSLCETDAAGTNVIEDVVTEAAGRYRIKLAQPLRPGATTTLTYRSTTGETIITARFTALPGDVNGDGSAVTADVGALVDCLNGVSDCAPWQCDIDRVPPCAPPDIGRLIDLLNGAGTFTSWLNYEVAGTQSCPHP